MEEALVQFFTFLQTLAPWVQYIFMGLGLLVVIGIVIDSLIPDEKDKGFMKYALGIPFLGELLKALAKFSPLNYKEPKKEEKTEEKAEEKVEEKK